MGRQPQEADIEAKALADVILATALDKKASDPAILAVTDLVGYADYFVVVSARSPRQVRAVATEVRQKLKHEHDLLPVGMEGLDSGKWVLIDYGDVVLHVFQEGSRAFYDLEGLWSDAERLPVPEDPRFADEDRPLFSLP